MDEECGFEVFGAAGGVGYAEEWVDGVAAAAVDDGAGGAEESAAEGGIGVGGLVGEEAVAPGFEELGVEVGGWLCGRLLFGGYEVWEGESCCEGGCSGGGELEHLAAGEIVFGHRGNGSKRRRVSSGDSYGIAKVEKAGGKGSRGCVSLSSSGSFDCALCAPLRMTGKIRRGKCSGDNRTFVRVSDCDGLFASATLLERAFSHDTL